MKTERRDIPQRTGLSGFMCRALHIAVAGLALLLAAQEAGFAQGIGGGAPCAAGASCPPSGGGNAVAGVCHRPADAGDPNPCEGDGAASQGSTGGPPTGAGNPVNLITGNKYQKETDLAALPGVLGLEIVRHYNSKYARDNSPGVLGRGWKLSYETVLYARPDAIHIVQADGARVTFSRDPKIPALCSTRDPGRGQIHIRRTERGEEEYTWIWTRGANAGRRLSFNTRGRLTRIEAASGEAVTLQYTPRGFLQSVTDPQGRGLQLNYEGSSSFQGVSSIDSPVGRYQYTYGDEGGGTSLVPVRRLSAFRESDAARAAPAKAVRAAAGARQQDRRRIGNLVRVLWPSEMGSPGRIYHYEESRHPNQLTGISQQGVDGAVQRLSSYSYDAQGYAVTSGPEGDDSIRIGSRTPPEPDLPGQPGHSGQTVLEDGQGKKTTYTHAILGGENRLLESRGAGCKYCGPANMRHRYNTQGQLQESTQLDESGRPVSGVRKTFDAWGRVTRIERIGYPAPGKGARPAAQAASPTVRLLVRYEYPAPTRSPEGLEIAFDRPALIARPGVAVGQEHRTEIIRNGRGQITRLTESGYRPELGVGRSGALITSHAPIRRVTDYRYTEINGRSLLTEIDGPLPNGQKGSPEDSDITRYYWDSQGRFVEQIARPGGIVHRLRHDGSGRVVNAVMDDGIRRIETQSAYTSRGVLTGYTRSAMSRNDPQTALTETQQYGVDLFERLVSATAADGSTQQLAYDGQGRLSGYTAPSGERIEWRYDPHGRPFAHVVFDAQGEVASARMTVRDDAGRVLAVLSPEGVDAFHPALPVSATASGSEGLRTVAVLQQRVWRDDFGRTVASLNPNDGLVLNQYESSAEGERQTQAYLGLRPSSAELSDPARAARRESLTFDAAGRLIRRERPGCTEKLAYEGRLLSRLESCGSVQHFERDAFGLITGHQQQIGERRFLETYRYGAGGRLLERQTAGGASLRYHYDEAGRLKGVTRPRGWTNWLSGTSAGRALVGWLPDSWTGQALQDGLQWSPLATQPGGATYANGARWQDRTDRAGRLSGTRLDTGAGTLYQASTHWYQGRPVQESRNGTRHTRLYDPEGRLLPGGLDPERLEGTHPWRLPASLRKAGSGAASVPAGSGTGAASMKPLVPTRFYTADGRRTSAWDGTKPDAPPKRNNWGEQLERHGQQLIWDAEGHLSGIEQNGRRVADYQYDARGLRVSKTLRTAAGDVRTFYLYDLSGRLSAEADGTGRIVREYLYNGARPYAMLEGERLYAIYSDARGLPLYMLDEGQQVVWQGHWDDWGGQADAPRPSKASLGLRLAGQYHDAESGLYYNVHRYYDPAQGAYISPDPLGERMGEHRYAYLNHDPLSGIDPLGLFGIPTTAFGGNYDALGPNGTDQGHGDIVNAAMALYHQNLNRDKPLGMQWETRFSPEIIDWIIRNNYHTDAQFNLLGQAETDPGQKNPLNHFDNLNASGPKYIYDEDGNPQLTESYADFDSIEAALGQINLNREAYGRQDKSMPDISQNIGRLGQNLHTLADFYAHTNWVDNWERGGCYKILVDRELSSPETIPEGYSVEKVEYGPVTFYEIYKTGLVPGGLERTSIWGEEVNINGGELFSGTAHDPWETLGSSQTYTHAYWNKDSSGSEGGKAKITEEQKAQLGGKYFWEARNYDPAQSSTYGQFGLDYITDTGKDPTDGDRIYVRKEITNAHELAMSLAIEHTVKEITDFYEAAKGVDIGDKKMGDILKMDKAALEAAEINYKDYPDKMGAYEPD